MQTLIFGGTFDPIHTGHLVLAELARESLEAERVLFIPTFRPPHKNPSMTPPEARFEMVKLSIEGNCHFEVSDIEIAREGPSYTIDTLRVLKEQKKIDLDSSYFLIGGDSLNEFHTWKNWREIIEMCPLAVVRRPGCSLEGPPEAIDGAKILDQLPLLEISSTEIRNRIRQGKTIRYMVGESVRRFIQEKELYKKECSVHERIADAH